MIMITGNLGVKNPLNSTPLQNSSGPKQTSTDNMPSQLQATSGKVSSLLGVISDSVELTKLPEQRLPLDSLNHAGGESLDTGGLLDDIDMLLGQIDHELHTTGDMSTESIPTEVLYDDIDQLIGQIETKPQSKSEDPKLAFKTEVLSQSSNNIETVSVKENTLPSEIKVATKQVDKEVAQQDQGSKDLASDVAKPKNFFSNFVTKLKEIGTAIKDFFVTNGEAKKVYEKASNDGKNYGADGLAMITSGKLSNAKREASDPVLITEGHEFRVQSKAVGSYLNNTFNKIDQGQQGLSIQTFTKELNQKIRLMGSDTEVKSFIAKIETALKDTRFDSNVGTIKNEFAQAFAELKNKVGSSDIILKNASDTLAKEIDDELKRPNAFFRGASEAPTFVQMGLKLDSPKFGEGATSTIQSLLVDLKQTDDFANLSLARKNMNSAKNDVNMPEEDKKLAIANYNTVLSNIALSLAPTVIENFFGGTEEEQKQFASKFLGNATQSTLRDMNETITKSPIGTVEDKNKAIAMWNSNNFVLRGLGTVVTALQVSLSKSDPELSAISLKIGDILTQAANNIQIQEQGKSGREFLNTDAYQNLRLALPNILKNVVSGCTAEVPSTVN